jgi:predicted dehydrogenase
MTIHRRDFIQTTLGAAAAVSMVRPSFAAADTKDIRVAQIGFRSQGSGHIGALGKNVVALCDVDKRVLLAKVGELAEKGQKVESFTDFRKLLDRKDIDAVSIATPNHTHALITVLAAQAGKDVYVEKPVSHNIWEGRQMVAAARKYGRIIQTGTQSRSSQSLKDAVAFVREGNLGEIRYAVGTCYKPRTSIGKSDARLEFPSGIDRDLWIGPADDQAMYLPPGDPNAPKFNYPPHYEWHWDFNTGAGDLGNQGIHQMDIARWFLGEPALAPRVFSVGGRLGYEDAGNTPNTQVIYHAYEKAPLIFEVRGLPRAKEFQKDGRWGGNMDKYRGSGVGVVVQCEKGYVLAPSYVEAIAFDADGKEIKRWQGGSSHHDNWLQAIAARDPKLLNAEIKEGHVSTAMCHAGNISYRVGQKRPTPEIAEMVAGNDLLANSVDRMFGHLRANGVDIDGEPTLTCGEWLDIDPSTDQFKENDAAIALWKREGRKPFNVPDIERDAAGQTAAAG